MILVDAGIKTFGWQGGTVHQVLREAKSRNHEFIKTTYNWGYREGQRRSNEGEVIELSPIPVNSWVNFDVDCFCSYVKGLIQGFEDYENNKEDIRKNTFSDY